MIKNNLIYVGSFTQVFEKNVPSLPSVHLSKFDLTHDWNMSKSIDQCHVCSQKRQDQVPLISFGSCHFVSTLTVILGVRVQGFLFAAPYGRLERETMSCSLKWKCPVWGFVVVLHNAVEEKHMGDQHRLLTASILMPSPPPRHARTQGMHLLQVVALIYLSAGHNNCPTRQKKNKLKEKHW